jgi:hypothetical protein
VVHVSILAIVGGIRGGFLDWWAKLWVSFSRDGFSEGYGKPKTGGNATAERGGMERVAGQKSKRRTGFAGGGFAGL